MLGIFRMRSGKSCMVARTYINAGACDDGENVVWILECSGSESVRERVTSILCSI
jgi:hypothetical protein